MTACVTLSPSLASASARSFWRIIAEISGGEYSLPPIVTRTSPFLARETLYGTRLIASWTTGSSNLRPMKRLIEKIVFSALVIAWRRARTPTSRSPVFGLVATTDGVTRWPSAFSRTSGSPASMTAIAELVVPRSMPMTLAMTRLLLSGRVGRSVRGGVSSAVEGGRSVIECTGAEMAGYRGLTRGRSSDLGPPRTQNHTPGWSAIRPSSFVAIAHRWNPAEGPRERASPSGRRGPPR